MAWLLFLFIATPSGVHSARAASSDDAYYKGETIRMIVAFSAGGVMTRIPARSRGISGNKYIPGSCQTCP